MGVDILTVGTFTSFTTEYIVRIGTFVRTGLAIQITLSFAVTVLKRLTSCDTSASLSTLLSTHLKSDGYITPAGHITTQLLITSWTTWSTKILYFGGRINLTNDNDHSRFNHKSSNYLPWLEKAGSNTRDNVTIKTLIMVAITLCLRKSNTCFTYYTKQL